MLGNASLLFIFPLDIRHSLTTRRVYLRSLGIPNRTQISQELQAVILQCIRQRQVRRRIVPIQREETRPVCNRVRAHLGPLVADVLSLCHLRRAIVEDTWRLIWRDKWRLLLLRRGHR